MKWKQLSKKDKFKKLLIFILGVTLCVALVASVNVLIGPSRDCGPFVTPKWF